GHGMRAEAEAGTVEVWRQPFFQAHGLGRRGYVFCFDLLKQHTSRLNRPLRLPERVATMARGYKGWSLCGEFRRTVFRDRLRPHRIQCSNLSQHDEFVFL